MPRRSETLRDQDFERLLSFRDGLRRFLHWSEGQAKAVGLTGSHHQLLLAIRGHGAAPSIGDVADHLLLRHHSVVELVDRAERAGLVLREADADDQRIVRLRLTDDGEAKLVALSEAHLEELARLGTMGAEVSGGPAR
jgi:DNA-binding MarR family transcriptional regulator